MKRRLNKINSIATTVFALGFAVQAQAESGTSVTGVVILDAPPKKREPIQLTLDSQKLYKKPLLNEIRMVSKKGQVANAFIHVKVGLPEKSYPVPQEPVLLNQLKSMFRPRVLGVRVGQEFLMRNSDPLIHNVRSLSSENRPFNIGQPAKTPDRRKVFTHPEGPIEIKCDFHPWMTAYIFVMAHPYFAVSNEKGQFKIDGLPPGEYTLTAWHEAFGEQDMEITIGANDLKDVGFSFKGDKEGDLVGE